MEWGGERERSGVQSLPTAWLPISLQYGTYLSSASHSHEHLALRFVKKIEKKTALKMRLNQYWSNLWSLVQSELLMSNHSPPLSMHRPPTDNHSDPRQKYFMTLNKAQHIREEQNGTSLFESSQLSPSHTESPIALWMCHPESVIFICPYTLEIITGTHLLCLFMHFCWSKATAESNKGCLIAALEKLMVLLRTFLCHVNIGKTQV